MGALKRPRRHKREEMAGWLERALERQEHRCHYCGVRVFRSTIPAERRFYPTLDHIIAIGRGGLNVEENTVCACQRCNTDKSDKWPEDFIWWLVEQRPNSYAFPLGLERSTWLLVVKAQHEEMKEEELHAAA